MLRFPEPVRILFKRLIIILFLYTVSRLLFFLFNMDYFRDASAGHTASLFIYGLRFDLCAIALTNSLLIILHLLPFSFFYSRAWQVLLNILFYLINSVALAFNAIDFVYFRFTNKRTTADFFELFSLGEDMGNTAPRIIADFWYIPAIFILLMVTAAWLYGKTTPVRKPAKSGMLASWIYLVPVLALSVMASRGGIQYVPLSILSASAYTSPQFTPLVLNTPFTILKTFGKSDLVLKEYFPPGELNSHFSVLRDYSGHGPFRPYNVVVIIMESFSSEYIGNLNHYPGYTPFLDSFSKQSMVFTNVFANGKKSIEGIPAVLSSLPQLMSTPYITSAYNGDELLSLASLLKKKNYESWFFHGGINGTMGFDRYTKMAGFDHYVGRKEYPEKGDFDGNWGIYDEPFFRFFANSLDHSRTPFAAAFFSISSHHPYSIPDSLHERFPKGTLPIHECIGYADHSLKRFFEFASHKSWFNQTLFVITADHTGPSEQPFYQGKAGMYAIPLLFYMPGKIAPGKSGITAQQADILPSVLDFLGYDIPFVSFGTSVFDSSSTHMAFTSINSIYQLFKDDHLLQFDGTQPTGLYHYTADSTLSVNLMQEKPGVLATHSNILKAVIQQYNERMLHNRLTRE